MVERNRKCFDWKRWKINQNDLHTRLHCTINVNRMRFKYNSHDLNRWESRERRQNEANKCIKRRHHRRATAAAHPHRASQKLNWMKSSKCWINERMSFVHICIHRLLLRLLFSNSSCALSENGSLSLCLLYALLHHSLYFSYFHLLRYGFCRTAGFLDTIFSML